MPHEDSQYPDEWFAIAEKDLHRVTRALADDDPELAGYCLQQSVEKFLKGFLISRGWKLRRVHDLVALLDDSLVYEPSFAQFRPSCETITDYYLPMRYPFAPDDLPSGDEVESSLEAISGLIEQIQQARSRA